MLSGVRSHLTRFPVGLTHLQNHKIAHCDLSLSNIFVALNGSAVLGNLFHAKRFKKKTMSLSFEEVRNAVPKRFPRTVFAIKRAVYTCATYVNSVCGILRCTWWLFAPAGHDAWG